MGLVLDVINGFKAYAGLGKHLDQTTRFFFDNASRANLKLVAKLGISVDEMGLESVKLEWLTLIWLQMLLRSLGSCTCISSHMWIYRSFISCQLLDWMLFCVCLSFIGDHPLLILRGKDPHSWCKVERGVHPCITFGHSKSNEKASFGVSSVCQRQSN